MAPRPNRRTLLGACAAAAAAGAAAAACGNDLGTDAVVREVILSPDTLRLQPGASGQLSAVGLDATHALVVGRRAAWRSATPGVVTVDDAGRVTAVALGNGTVVATVDGASDTAAVLVAVIPIDRITVAPSPLSLQEGETSQLSAVARDAAGHELTGRTFAWSSDLESVARVSSAGLLTALAPGSATISVSSEGVTTTVPVTVTARPAIALSAAAVSFVAQPGGANTPFQSVSVSNSGGGALTGLSLGPTTYGAGASGWLTATIDNSVQPAVVSLGARPAGLAVGTYTATVPVQSPVARNSPQSIAVTFTVTTSPAILLSRGGVAVSAQAFGADPAAQTVTVSNGGGGSLAGLAVGTIAYGPGATGWLTASLSSAAAPSTLTLQARTGTLAPGTYTATVPVAGTGAVNSPQSVVVAFTVTPQPAIGLERATMADTLPATSNVVQLKTVAVTNAGGGALAGLTLDPVAYDAGSAAGWLTASLAGGSAPSTISLAFSGAGVPRGTHTASVVVRSSTPGVSPRTLTVSLRAIYTLSRHVQGPAFDAPIPPFNSCSSSGCHSVGGARPILAASASFAELLGDNGAGTKYVTPFDADVVANTKNVLRERVDCITPTRRPMPLLGSQFGQTCASLGKTFPQALSDLVRDWILDGAKP